MKTLNLFTLRRVLSIAAVLGILLTLVPPAPTLAAPPKSGTAVYFVQYGDTLYSISRRFGTTVPAIMAANGLNTDYIYVGQRLLVPIGGGYPVPAPGSSFNCQYVVQPRDTLFSIAYRYRVSVGSLMQANYLWSPYIYVGQRLRVPCLTPQPSPFPTHIVQAGENLFRIAVRYGTTIYAIAVVNGIANPNLIFVGQTLVIPYPNTVTYPPIPTITPTVPVTTTVTPTATPGGEPISGTAAIVMRNLAFEPRELLIRVGTTVTWMNIDTVTHTVTSGVPNTPSGLFRSPQLATTQTFSFTFTNAGTYPYYCELHPSNMTGTITVVP